MLNKFDQWRRANMQRFSNACMHYYRIDDEVIAFFCNFLTSVLRNRVENNSRTIVLNITDDFADAALDLLDQVDNAYIHPRSTSARVRFVRQHREASFLC